MVQSKPLTYCQRIEIVLNKLAEQFHEEIRLSDMASAACLSPFHFHRIFKALVGATPAEVLQSFRLERAAYLLAKDQKKITDVAIDCGYQSPEAFSRVFKSAFGVSPKQYQKSDSPPKIQKRLLTVAYNPGTGLVNFYPMETISAMKYEVIVKPEISYAFVEHTGAYMELRSAFDALVAWCEKSQINWKAEQIFSLSYDNPQKIHQDLLRSEACISLMEEYPVSGLVKLGTRSEQNYAVYLHKGHYKYMQDVYQQFLQFLTVKEELEIDDAPFMENYLNDPYQTPETEWLTELCIPVQRS